MSQGSMYATTAKLSSGNRKQQIRSMARWEEEPKEKKMNFFKRWLVNIANEPMKKKIV